MTRVYDCDHRHDLPFAEVKRLVGGKAANLAVMAVDLGLPVPPAFTITTTACNEYLANGWPDGLDAELREHMARIEGLVGRRFGGPGDPLLVSVRSGAPVSMPGMMDTILNLGLTSETTAGLAAASGSEAFAAELPCALRRDVPRHRRHRDGPGGPVGAAASGDRGRLPLLEQRPGADVPGARRDRRRPRDGRDRAGDGVRQPQRWTPARASCSRGTRRPASRSSTAT